MAGNWLVAPVPRIKPCPFPPLSGSWTGDVIANGSFSPPWSLKRRIYLLLVRAGKYSYIHMRNLPIRAEIPLLSVPLDLERHLERHPAGN